jgi:hypothetical protein
LSYGGLGILTGGWPKVKRKIFLSYHHGGDQVYYNAFSQTFHDNYDIISDNSIERVIDSENVNYVMQRIRDKYITGTSCTIVLVGRDTWGRKYVDWEIKATLEKQHGLIGVLLPTLRANSNGTYTVPVRLLDNIAAGYALWITWASLTSSPEACASHIEQANMRDKILINNTSDRRLRNA